MKTTIVKRIVPVGTVAACDQSVRKTLRTRASFGMAFMLGLLLTSSALGQTTWQGGTGNWGLGTNWSAGVPNSTTNAFVDSDNGTNSVVNVNVFASVNDLTIDFGDVVNINNAQRLSIHGNLFNNGLLIVGSTGASTYFQPVGTITFSGTGAVELTHSTAWLYDNSNSNAASDHLINSASHTIRGLGNIGFSSTLQI
ncbi:MAG TPA: hypothetical protein PKD54_14540, partial [Pirellulaceae bacterium]|nr:hypothetical protein [Pirellulaceae bacterium]